VAKLCIEIPELLLKWLKETTKELGIDPESFIMRLLWQYHDIANASERAHTKAYSGMQCKETPEGFLLCTD